MENNLQLPKAETNKYIESAEYARKVQSAYFRLRPKIFIERFKNLNTIAQIGIFFFPVISIITSISFIYGHIQMAINNIYVAIIIAVLLLGIVELTKNHLLSNALDTFFSNSGRSLGTFAFAFLFSALSFIMSYNGAEMLVKNLDNSKQEIKDSTSYQLAAIESNYNNQIAIEQSKIAAINEMAKKQWHGLNTPQQTTLLNSLESNVKDLRLLMEKKRDEILTDKTVNLQQADQSVNYNAWIFKLFAAIIEVMLILSITFNAFYAFKTVREDLDLKEFKSDPAKYQANETNKFKSITASPQIQAPSIGLNSGNDRSVIKGFLADFFNENPMVHDDRAQSENDFVHDDRAQTKSEGKRVCKNCGNEFEFKHWNKTYCSSECRINFWENNTGKILKFKPNK